MCMYVRVYECLCVYLCICVCVRVCVHACVHACVRVCVRVCVCTQIYYEVHAGIYILNWRQRRIQGGGGHRGPLVTKVKKNA